MAIRKKDKPSPIGKKKTRQKTEKSAPPGAPKPQAEYAKRQVSSAERSSETRKRALAALGRMRRETSVVVGGITS